MQPGYARVPAGVSCGEARPRGRGRTQASRGKQMEISRRDFCSGLAAAGVALPQAASEKVVRYVRYENRGKVSYGLLDGDSIREIRGGLFGNRAETGAKVKLA